MMSSEPIHPLKDVWLRPRRVFRELAKRPIGTTDYVLAAAQGIGNYLALFRSEFADPHMNAWSIIGSALVLGPLFGVAGVYFFAMLYGRLGNRAGGASTRNQVFHVLSYGGIPVVAGLALWGLTALVVGEAALVDTPGRNVDGFVVLLLKLQVAVYVLLLLWSVVLQVMGISEIQGLATRKAFVVWVLGQLLGIVAAFFLAVAIAILLPGLVPSPPS